MDDSRRAFLDDLLSASTPSGYEAPGQRVWVDYVSDFADEVRTDDYGNAVAVSEGSGPEIAVAGHADQIGLLVREIDDEGHLHVSPVGSMDATVTRGQQVTVHADDGPVPGVIGQTAIHVREDEDGDDEGVADQHVDVGAADGEAAGDLVAVGDPITIDGSVTDLQGSRVAAPGLDNRAGMWTAAEAFRRAVAADAEATVYAVSTVQEEVGLQGARMVGFDLDPDAVVAVDVTHALDYPDAPDDRASDVALGDGPVLSRGSANHPALVDALRATAADTGVGVQLQSSPTTTRTDADAFYTSRSGIPSTYLGVPNRYMHTPVEVVDAADLAAAADLLAAFLADAGDHAPFTVDI
ncbi:M42 family metallopeptidase [Halostella sp. JP-L12]|uniref:M20/M25/M40 family metallo-hydrolase n=1 Tax=Halostella TaxID=1843185 RepID=UPI000EF7E45D|nr:MULTISPECIES: M20/M25/M40 family metallo-hydrolase [Halostella]NHN48654.1 M42 family metallopeptidase [Halostella sp. JP-L12]